ncbi:methionine adenosyltransferase [PVC group bacterium (ex Bugula neritina AB1)]|nr:methionine adenosyltransferase [PVC group bacterium (ex Bugula neritina AB1)]
MRRTYLLTSESVGQGHPDKMADQISDQVLDALLEKDIDARVACETLLTKGVVVVAGEISTKATVDIQTLVREKIRDIGFDHSDKGFDYKTCAVLIAIDEQSPDIAQGVNVGEGLHKGQGAGDQGLMYGYACDETDSYMPLPISLSHALVKELADLRHSNVLDYLWPDCKSQVTVEYDEDGIPLRIDAVVLSTQHHPDVDHLQIESDMQKLLIEKTLPKSLVDKETKIYVNPTGRFVVGGPLGDCGLTGRKIMVDTYGGIGRHGGGAFSGKDPSKVDRSAAYAARYVAKNIVAAGLAKRCEIQVAYAIGVEEPVSLHVNTFGTSVIEESKIETIIRKEFDLRPKSIIESLDLKRPIYGETALYGHFGRLDVDFSWEKLDKVEVLRRAKS